MTAIRALIFEDIEAALASGTGAAEVEVMPSGDPSRFPALHVLDDGQGREQSSEAYVTRYGMAFSIEGFVQGAGGKAAHQQLMTLYAASVAAIMAMADNSTRIETIEEGEMRIAVAALASTRRLAFSLDFTLTYATRRGEPENL